MLQGPAAETFSNAVKPSNAGTVYQKSALVRAGQEQVSYEALKVSHTFNTFSMDDSGAQTCLQHENLLVPVSTKPLGVNTCSPFLYYYIWQGLR